MFTAIRSAAGGYAVLDMNTREVVHDGLPEAEAYIAACRLTAARIRSTVAPDTLRRLDTADELNMHPGERDDDE